MILGIDAGGTSLKALAMDDQGTSRCEIQAGPANLATMREELIRANLAEVARKVPFPAAVCACFAGLLSEADRLRAESLLQEAFVGAIVSAYPDYVAAYEACEPSATCCVIAGTGAVVTSKLKTGEYVRSGGAGPLLGDRGSRFDVVRTALRDFFEGFAEPEPEVAALLSEKWGSADRNEVIAAIYRAESPASAVASLLGPLVELADNHDSWKDRLSRAIDPLAEMAHRHLVAHHPSEPSWQVELTGGLFDSHPLFHNAFRAAIERHAGREVSVERSMRMPVEGAVAIARRLIAVS